MSRIERPLETSDIQGIVLSGYMHLKYSNYLFLNSTDVAATRTWLADIAAHVTTAKYPVKDGKIQKPDPALNIAFTAPGVEAMGYSIDTFSQEFKEGIAFNFKEGEDGTRSARLGDTYQNSPLNWEVGNPQAPPEQEIHICLMVQAKDEIELELFSAAERAKLSAHGLNILREEIGFLPLEDGKEHFGFADAISEPDMVGSPKRLKDAQACIEPGEFILGYNNEYDRLPATPTVSSDTHNNLQPVDHAPDPSAPDYPPPKDLGRNGTYMVFRKLYQDVAGWRRYFMETFPPEEQELMQAKFIGRWPSGAPLVQHPDVDPCKANPHFNGRVNDFCYTSTDQAGLRCPIGAHIRRVNPRDSLEDDPEASIGSVKRHRLLRRGALYGKKMEPGVTEDDGVPRGVLFLGLNTDIKRQFEFIQQTWIQRPKFNGLYDETDPVLGNHSHGDGFNNLTVQNDPVRRRLTGLPQFVTLKGGAYFFVPSISALYYFANVRNPRKADYGRLR